MNNKKRLSLEEYAFIKKHSYVTASFLNTLSMKDFANFIKTGIPYDKNSQEYQIYISTLILPNDISVLKSYMANHDVNALAKKYNLPFSILASKIIEFSIYNFPKLLEEKVIDINLANQNIDLLRVLDDTDLNILREFPNQPYVESKKEQNEKIKQNILESTRPFKF